MITVNILEQDKNKIVIQQVTKSDMTILQCLTGILMLTGLLVIIGWISGSLVAIQGSVLSGLLSIPFWLFSLRKKKAIVEIDKAQNRFVVKCGFLDKRCYALDQIQDLRAGSHEKTVYTGGTGGMLVHVAHLEIKLAKKKTPNQASWKRTSLIVNNTDRAKPSETSVGEIVGIIQSFLNS